MTNMHHVTRHNISYENLSSDVVLTKEIETWRAFIDNLPSDEDKVVFTKLLDDYYKYSVALNNQAQEHPFPGVFDSSTAIDTA